MASRAKASNHRAERTELQAWTNSKTNAWAPYRISIEIVALADQMASAFPRGRAYLADQLRRAASSIPRNIAEGAGELAAADKTRFYRSARRSATESAAIIDALAVFEFADEPLRTRARGLLLLIVDMLTAMVLKISGSGSGYPPCPGLRLESLL